MKKYNCLGISVILFFLIFAGCATSASLKAVVSDENQSLSYKNNFQILISRKNLYDVRIFPAKDIIEPYQILDFGLSIHNKSDKILKFSYDNIKAFCGNIDLKILTYDEALADFERKNNVDLTGLTPEQMVFIMNRRSQTNFYENKSREYNEYAATLLKRESIPPKSYHHGIIKIDSPNPVCDVFAVEVGLSKESHKFVFQLQHR